MQNEHQHHGIDRLSSITNYFKNRQTLLMLGLCFLVVYMVLGAHNQGKASFLNASFIMKLELFFLLLYLVLLWELPDIVGIVKSNKLTTLVILVWFASITFSLFNAPPHVLEKSLTWARYFQTIVHMFFFLFIWDFFRRFQPDLKLLYYVIPLSSFIVACYFFVEWMNYPYYAEKFWLEMPPLNANIRHTGYQVEAAISLFLAFFLFRTRNHYENTVNIFILVFLWAFLLWLGGRGATLSVVGTVFLIFVLLRFKRVNCKWYALVLLAGVAGFFISDMLSVFDWSGLRTSVSKTIEAESVNQVTSNRIMIWESTLGPIRENLFFGLGPQGYYFMENRIFGVQPHNIFLQFMLEWGLSGTLLFIFLLIKGFWTGVKLHVLDNKERINIYPLGAGAVITTLTINSLIDGTYFHPQPVVYLAIAYAVWVVDWNRKESRI